MMSADLASTIAALPKVDLHRHLEGSLRPDDALRLGERWLSGAAGNRGTEPNREDAQPPILRSLWSPLSPARSLGKALRPETFVDSVIGQAVADAARDNVHYLELRFTPAEMMQSVDAAVAEVTDWVVEFTRQAADESGIGVGLILSIDRHSPAKQAQAVAQAAVDRKAKGVVGLDLAGEEAGSSIGPFVPLFAAAKRAGLGITVHAENLEGPAILEILELLDADRIGHGLRVLEHANALAAARERRAVFEVCLTSNLRSGLIPGWGEHPLPRMILAGLQVSLNTDNPGHWGVQLSDEYLRAVCEMNLSLETVKAMILAAVQGSFAPPRLKRDLEANLVSEWMGAM